MIVVRSSREELIDIENLLYDANLNTDGDYSELLKRVTEAINRNEE